AQVGLASVLIGAVASEAGVGEDGTNIAIEFDRVRGQRVLRAQSDYQASQGDGESKVYWRGEWTSERSGNDC
ncbi:MAG: hypothetical protein ACKN82_09755, partial [Pirellula sp.]